jgi:hypothetical protein
LHDAFSLRVLKYLRYNTIEGKIRNRIFKFRANSIFSNTEDMLFFILYYLKNAPLQEVIAATFNISQPKANMYIHFLTKMLREGFKKSKFLPLRDGTKLDARLRSLDINVYYCDGTEREIPRSVDYELQKEYYSGKAKKHTIKNNVISDGEGRAIYLSDTYTGKTHDKKILDNSNITLNDDSIGYFDTGFKGYKNDKGIIIIPAKKRKGSELTEDEKKENKNISSDRVKNEHTMGGIKRLRIVKDKLRVWANDFRDNVMVLACCLHNFRLSSRSWSYPELKTNSQNYIS